MRVESIQFGFHRVFISNDVSLENTANCSFYYLSSAVVHNQCVSEHTVALCVLLGFSLPYINFRG